MIYIQHPSQRASNTCLQLYNVNSLFISVLRLQRSDLFVDVCTMRLVLFQSITAHTDLMLPLFDALHSSVIIHLQRLYLTCDV